MKKIITTLLFSSLLLAPLPSLAKSTIFVCPDKIWIPNGGGEASGGAERDDIETLCRYHYYDRDYPLGHGQAAIAMVKKEEGICNHPGLKWNDCKVIDSKTISCPGDGWITFAANHYTCKPTHITQMIVG